MIPTNVPFSVLKGKILKSITNVDDADYAILITTSENEMYIMRHEQDCCETVSIEDIAGDLEWLIDSPILIAEERSNSGNSKGDSFDDSCTWTFYELATIKGAVTIRWYGSSNGYYSESVDFVRLQ